MNKTEHLRRSFSQFGEDCVLIWIFHGVRNGFYVDVGCHHPYRISNTAVLHDDAEWTGINIDLDENSIKAFDVARPSDINLCMGVGKEAGFLDAVIFDEGALSTFDLASETNPAWASIPRRRRRVAVDTLTHILEEHLPAGRAIDLLNIDAEGLDFDILSTIDWDRYLPSVIAVETQELDLGNVRSNRTFNLLSGLGYRLASHVAITSIYRR